MVNSNKLEYFNTSGVLPLLGVIKDETIQALKEHFSSEIMNNFNIDLKDPETWYQNPFNPAGGSLGKRLNGMNPIMDKLRENKHLDKIIYEINKSIANVFGKNKLEPIERMYSLLSFPGTENNWNVPHKSWHNDEPIVANAINSWSIFVFIFLDEVSIKTGPTMAITGSHRRGELIARDEGINDAKGIQAFESVNKNLIKNPESEKILPIGKLLDLLVDQDPWYKGLVTEGKSETRIKNFLEGSSVQYGIKNQVTSITGSPGDIVILDPRCIHTYSANISNSPRQILRLDFRRLA